MVQLFFFFSSFCIPFRSVPIRDRFSVRRLGNCFVNKWPSNRPLFFGHGVYVPKKKKKNQYCWRSPITLTKPCDSLLNIGSRWFGEYLKVRICRLVLNSFFFCFVTGFSTWLLDDRRRVCRLPAKNERKHLLEDLSKFLRLRFSYIEVIEVKNALRAEIVTWEDVKGIQCLIEKVI